MRPNLLRFFGCAYPFVCSRLKSLSVFDRKLVNRPIDLLSGLFGEINALDYCFLFSCQREFLSFHDCHPF